MKSELVCSAPFWLLLFFQTDSIGHSLTIQYGILTTTSSSSRETERGTWEPDCLFTQWARSQTGVWPADLTPRQTHRVKQPRRIKLSWVRFEFLSATFFHHQELFEKLKKELHFSVSEVALRDTRITTWKYAVKNQCHKQQKCSNWGSKRKKDLQFQNSLWLFTAGTPRAVSLSNLYNANQCYILLRKPFCLAVVKNQTPKSKILSARFCGAP